MNNSSTGFVPGTAFQALLRGALFTVSHERETFSVLTNVASLGDAEINFLGTRFNQDDLDVAMYLFNLQRDIPIGEPIGFAAYDLLKTIGREDGGTDYEVLNETLARLAAGLVEINWKEHKRSVKGTLFPTIKRDTEKEIYELKFNEDLFTLYERGHTYIDPVKRQRLGRNQVAKWLQAFYAGHDTPFPMKTKTLMVQSGSSMARLGDFRKALRIALDKLVEMEELRSWSIDPNTDLVTVTKFSKKRLSK